MASRTLFLTIIVTASLLVCAADSLLAAPANPRATLDSARTLLNQGKRGEALPLIENAVKTLSERAAQNARLDAESVFLLGRARYYLGQTDKALKLLGRAITMAPDRSHYRFIHGVILRREKDPRAIAALTQAARLAPKAPHHWLELSRALQDRKDSDRALAALRKAIAADPRFVAAHYDAGVLHESRGDIAAALACFRKVASLTGNDPKVRAKMAKLEQILAGRTE